MGIVIDFTDRHITFSNLCLLLCSTELVMWCLHKTFTHTFSFPSAWFSLIALSQSDRQLNRLLYEYKSKKKSCGLISIFQQLPERTHSATPFWRSNSMITVRIVSHSFKFQSSKKKRYDYHYELATSILLLLLWIAEFYNLQFIKTIFIHLGAHQRTNECACAHLAIRTSTIKSVSGSVSMSVVRVRVRVSLPHCFSVSMSFVSVILLFKLIYDRLDLQLKAVAAFFQSTSHNS